MKFKQRLLVIVLAILLIAPLSGVKAQDSKVTIHWWHIFTSPKTYTDFAQKLADDYMKDHPNVNIEITVLENDAFKTRLATVMQSGEPPDLFHSWGGGVLGNFAAAGLLRDITPEMTADSNKWRDTFAAQAALDLYKFDGKYYGVANDWGGVGFWYNKDLFAKAGIKETPKTWTDFLADVKTLKAAGITPIALGEKEKWPGHFWWVYLAVREGGKAAFDAAYSRTGSFADKPFVQAGERLKELIDLKPFPEGFLGLTYPQEAAVFGNGEGAMELMGQWAPGVQASSAKDTKGIPTDKLGWFPFPMVEGGAGDPTDMMGGGNGIAVGKNAPDEAVDFLKYLSSADVQKQFIAQNVGFVPTNKGAQDALTDPMLKLVMEGRDSAKYFQLYYDQFLPPAIAQAVLDNVEGIYAGTISPEDAAKGIDEVAANELKPMAMGTEAATEAP